MILYVASSLIKVARIFIYNHYNTVLSMGTEIELVLEHFDVGVIPVPTATVNLS